MAEQTVPQFAAGAGGSGGSADQGADTAPQQTPEEAAMAASTSSWPACRRNCRCSCGAAPRSWRTSGTASTEGAELRHRHPSAETFALLAERLAGVEVDGVTRLEVPDRPSLMVFDVRRHRRGPLLVVWEQRTTFDGEDQPPVGFDWPWPAAQAIAVDALGQEQPAEVLDGRLKLPVSLTPVFVAAD